MAIFTRNEQGILMMQTLELQILFEEMFSVAESESDVDWILENINGCAEMISEERMEELND